MKKYLFLCVALVLLGCQSSLSTTKPQLGEEVEVKVGEKVAFRDAEIILQFKKVIEDSRCPNGVECVWAGNAKILIRLNQQSLKLNTHVEPQEETIGKYHIQLVSLSPYPEFKHAIEQDEYVATFLITQK